MTQRQRRARAQRAGARRRKVNAAVVAWKKMNPGKKLPAAVRVKRLTGGGFSVTPVRLNISAKAQRKLAMTTRRMPEGSFSRQFYEKVLAHERARKKRK